MILPVKFLWEQLDGPQVNAICTSIFEYWKQMFDPKLDYINTLNVNTADDEHLTFLGILANFVRPVITVPDKDFFYFTVDPEHGSVHGLSSIEDRFQGGRLTAISGATTEPRPISTEHYRVLLKAYIEGDGELGGLMLLDDICYALSMLDNPEAAPFYTFEFMEGNDIPEGRAPGDVYIDIGGLDDWNNPMQIYAILRGLAKSVYWPAPQIYISIDATVNVPAPTASLPSGTYNGKQEVTLSCGMSKAAIYYTVDGSTPTSETIRYIEGEPIIISEDTVLRTRAIAPGHNSSSISEYNYKIIL